MLRRLVPDTLRTRFIAAVLLAAIAMAGLNALFTSYGGVWSKPPLPATGLLNQAYSVKQIVDVASASIRPSLVAAVKGQGVEVSWYPQDGSQAAILNSGADRSGRNGEIRDDIGKDAPTLPIGRRLLFSSAGPTASRLGIRTVGNELSYYLAVELTDRSWVVFSSLRRSWGLPDEYRRAIEIGFLACSILAASLLATRLLSEPINHLARGVRRFGLDPAAAPLMELGPRELRAVIRAFNDMQAQIQRFLLDRTEMLAAISHDLRTPLTRLRLRAELMEDAEQRRWLFRNVDEMQAMVDSALSFFRDDVSGEQPTKFDLPELLQSIADEYNDQNVPVLYDGPSRIAHVGRPYALKRAIVNLVENAIKYATPPSIQLAVDPHEARLVVLDEGPGIPEDKLNEVFTPFLRLERSRNRATGGVGLGLTAARSIVRAHGGDISLANRPGGGLAATVILPISERL